MVNYVYADDAAPLLPAGTILHTIMWHDNSDSSRNPIPIRTHRLSDGERTVDEMGSAWLSYYYMSDEDFKKETEARKAQRNRHSRVHGEHTVMVKRGSSQHRYLGWGSVRDPCFCSRGPAQPTTLRRPSIPGSRYARGQDVSPTFDGWERNPDGTFSMWFGYYNRNTEEEVDVPIGPENNFDLGNGDQGQPTHFYTGRKVVGVQGGCAQGLADGQAASVDTHEQGQNESVQGLAGAGMGSGQTC